MCMDATISVALIFSLIAAAGTIVTIASTFLKQRENEEAKRLEMEKNFVKLNVKIDGFCDTTRDLMKQNDKMLDQSQELNKQMISCSERICMLFRYKDDHEKRIGELENKVK